MTALEARADIITRLQQCSNKSIQECLKSISPIVLSAILEKPAYVDSLQGSVKDTPTHSRSLLDTLNSYAFLYNLCHIEYSASTEYLRQLVSTYPDAHFLILLCLYTEIVKYESSSNMELADKNFENLTVALLNATHIMFGSSKDTFFQPSSLKGGKMFFNCIEHKDKFSRSKKGLDSILDKCQFSGAMAESSMEVYLTSVAQLNSEDPSFPLRVRAFLERFWLCVLNLLALMSTKSNVTKNPNRLKLRGFAELTLVGVLKDAHRFIFPFCVDATSFADLSVSNFEALTTLEYDDGCFVYKKVEFSPLRHIATSLPYIATTRSAMALSSLCNLITVHGLKYDKFFHEMTKLLNPWLLELDCFGEVLKNVERILMQPTIPVQHLRSCFYRISTLAAKYASSSLVVHLVGLMSRLLAAHPSLNSLLPKIYAVGYKIQCQESKRDLDVSRNSLCNARLHFELGLLALHPHRKVRVLAREMIFGLSNTVHLQPNPRKPAKRAILGPCTENQDSLATLWSI